MQCSNYHLRANCFIVHVRWWTLFIDDVQNNGDDDYFQLYNVAHMPLNSSIGICCHKTSVNCIFVSGQHRNIHMSFFILVLL